MTKSRLLLCAIWMLVILAFPSSGVRSAQLGRPVISAQNIAQLNPIKLLGRGYLGAVAWSPDGNTLAVGSTSGVWLYDAHDFSRAPRWLGNLDFPATRILFSPDGKKLVVYNRLTQVMVWNLDPERLETEITIDNQGFEQITSTGDGIDYSPILDVYYDAQGRLLITSGINGAPGGFHVWDATTRQDVLVGKDDADWVSNIAHSPDGSLFVVSEGQLSFPAELHIWTAGEPELEMLMVGGSSPVNSLVFSPNGRYFATGSGNVPSDFADANADLDVHLWDVKTRQIRLTLKGHTGWVSKVVFSPDNHLLASGSGDTTLRLWSVENGSLRAVLKGHTGAIIDAAFSPDSKQLASVAGDGTVRIWNTATGRQLVQLTGYSGIPFPYVGPDGPGIPPDFAFTSDGTNLGFTVSGGEMQVWNTETGMESQPPRLPSGLSLTSQLTAYTNPQLLALWNKSAFRGLLTADTFFSAEFSPDRKYLVYVDTIHDLPKNDIVFTRLWSTQPLNEIAKLPFDDDNSIIFSPDSRQIIVMPSLTYGSVLDKADISVWDIASHKEQYRLAGPPSGVIAWRFSPDGKRLAVAYEDGAIFERDLQSGKILHRLTFFGAHGYPEASFTSQLDKVIFSGTSNYGNQVQIADLDSGSVVTTIDNTLDYPLGLMLSRDEQLVFVANSNQIYVWSVKTGKLVRTLNSRSQVRKLGFSPDGSLLAVMNDDDVVELWAVASIEF